MEKFICRTWVQLLLFLMIATGLGGLGAFVYVYTIDLMPNIYFCVITGALFACFLALVLKKTVGWLKLADSFSVFIVTLVALLIMTYVKWNCFFGLQYAKYQMLALGVVYDHALDFARTVRMMVSCTLHPAYFFDDLVMFNDIGTWGIITGQGVADNVHGNWLGVIWALEFTLLTGYPLFAVLRGKRT